MKFWMFHLMPWPYLPADFEEKYDTAWVTCPNSLFAPERGPEVYHRYINQLAYADELGFDGVVINEHHQNAYGLMPSPNLIAAALSQRVQKARVMVLGNGLPLYEVPLKIAEEFAMLDNMFRGKFDAGFKEGIAGAEVALVPGAAHALLLEQPQRVAETVTQFLKR